MINMRTPARGYIPINILDEVSNIVNKYIRTKKITKSEVAFLADVEWPRFHPYTGFESWTLQIVANYKKKKIVMTKKQAYDLIAHRRDDIHDSEPEDESKSDNRTED